MFGREKAIGQLDAPPTPRPSNGAAPALAPAPAHVPVDVTPSTESVLAATLAVKGDVEFEGALRIEGEVRGRITGQGRLFVNRGGRVLGDIIAAVVVIQGRVQGNIVAADRLQIEDGAEVIGDVKAGKMVVAEGAKLLGRLDVNSDSLELPSSMVPEKAAEPDALGKIL
jgi:cytoskeletal protein CcmA (bactofilin family)